MNDPIYVGSGRIVKRDGKEDMIAVQIDLTELAAKKALYEPYVKTITFRDGPHRLLNLVVAPMKPENQKEYKTHSVKVDTWVKPLPEDESQDEIPF